MGCVEERWWDASGSCTGVKLDVKESQCRDDGKGSRVGSMCDDEVASSSLDKGSSKATGDGRDPGRLVCFSRRSTGTVPR